MKKQYWLNLAEIFHFLGFGNPVLKVQFTCYNQKSCTDEGNPTKK